jgi:hypothetical protein
MNRYTILRCDKCGKVAAYCPKIRTSCGYCFKKIKPEVCFKVKENVSHKDMLYLLQRVKEEVVRVV